MRNVDIIREKNKVLWDINRYSIKVLETYKWGYNTVDDATDDLLKAVL